jgi:pimeloyl-ACP methyl ester carboxylesterase
MNFEFEKKKIEVLGKQIQTYSFGEGDKIVFLFPSFPHSGLYFRWLFYKCDLSKLKMITFDLPGWIGYSESYKKGEEYSMESVVEIGRGILDFYKVEKFSVLGYSFGGSLALKIAADWEDRVEKIVLVSAVLNSMEVEGTKYVRWVNLAKRLQAGSLMKNFIIRKFNSYRKYLRSEGLDKDYMDMYMKMVANIDSKILLESIYTLFHSDWSCYLDRVKKMRVLVVNSSDEDIMFRKQAERIRRKLENYKSLFISGDHDNFLLKPDDKVVGKIISFLSEQ